MPVGRRVFALIFLAGISSGSQQEARIRSEWVQGFPFVDAFVNGRGPFVLLVDSGATLSVLSPEAAAKARLRYDRRSVQTTITGEETTLVSSGADIRVGRDQVRGDITVSGLGPLLQVNPKADGILGQSFLAHIPYIVDFEKRKFLIGETASEQAPSMIALPVDLSAHDRPVLLAHLNFSREPSRFVLDTGASELFIICGDRCPQLDHAQETRTESIGHASHARVGTLASFQLGALRLNRQPAVLVDSMGYEAVDGLLAARWFAAIFVDLQRQVVRVRPQGRFPPHD